MIAVLRRVDSLALGRHVRTAFVWLTLLFGIQCVMTIAFAYRTHRAAHVIDISSAHVMDARRIADIAAIVHLGRPDAGWRTEFEHCITGIEADDAEAQDDRRDQVAIEQLQRRYVAAARALEREPGSALAFSEFQKLRGPYVAALDAAVRRRAEIVAGQDNTLIRAAIVEFGTDACLIFAIWFWLIRPVQRRIEASLDEVDGDGARLQSLFDENPDAIAVYDRENRLVSTNQARCALLGRRADEMIGKPYTEFLPPERHAAALDAIERATNGEFVVRETQLLAADGRLIDVQLSIFPHMVAGEVTGVITAARDIRDIRAAKARSDRLAGRLEALCEIASAADDHWLVQVNAALALAAWQLAYEHGVVAEVDALGRGVAIIATAGDPPGIDAGRVLPPDSSFTERIVQSHEFITIDNLNASADWRTYNDTKGTAWQSVTAAPLRIDGSITGALILASTQPRMVALTESDRDFVTITAALLGAMIDRGRYAERLGTLAFTDTLTGLPNRAAVTKHLEVLIADARRRHEGFAVHFIDLDRFKCVNDGAGHDAGDLVLRETARRFRACIRAGDTIARLGGDEFVVLQPTANGRDGAAELAERMIAAIGEPFTIGGGLFSLGCSIGISVYPADGADAQTLLRRADEAMYRAKRDGDSGAVFAA